MSLRLAHVSLPECAVNPPLRSQLYETMHKHSAFQLLPHLHVPMCLAHRYEVKKHEAFSRMVLFSALDGSSQRL